MHDIKWIREQPEAFDAAMKCRKSEMRAADILKLDEEQRKQISTMQLLEAERNALAKSIGVLKSQGKHDEADAALKRAGELKDQIAALKAAQENEADSPVTRALEVLPNALAADVVDGADESANVLKHSMGTPREFEFEPKDHVALGEALGMMDFENAAKISGARFVILSGALARLERALAQFMLDLHTVQHGYTEVNPPLLVRDSALYGTGQLPKFEEDVFQSSFFTAGAIKTLEVLNKTIYSAESTQRIQKAYSDYNPQESHSKVTEDLKKRLWLIPTSEVSLTNIVADSIVSEETLPRRYTAHTPCFRLEAGSAGRDTRGMIRQHQFTKVELVSITRPEDSEQEHERMLACAEEVLRQLELPYRVMTLCSGDTGFSARKTYDIEVWLPAQNMYREISSCSNCGDFQARRMKARYKNTEGKNEFVHTLNGSGVAVGRALVAVLENYQQVDGSIVVPTVLQKYMGGLEVIRK